MNMNNLGSAVSTVASVANEILSLGDRESILIDPMKLQKLIFYSHAWHLAYKNSPLFEADFEAWPWGPVVADVYSQTKSYGRKPITGRISELRSNDVISFFTPDGVDSKDLKDFILEIWNAHKRYTGIQLSNATHAEGEPWTIIKQHYGSLDDKPIIPNPLIASIFKKKIHDANTTSRGTVA